MGFMWGYYRKGISQLPFYWNNQIQFQVLAYFSAQHSQIWITVVEQFS